MTDTEASQRLHILVVTKIADAESDDYEYTVECPVPQPPGCHLWSGCEECDKTQRPITDEENGEGEYIAHDTHHQKIEDRWMTETTDCALTATGSGCDGVQDVAIELGVGTHYVDVEYWGDGAWEVVIPKQATS